ncbi:MAG: DUF3048 domain-containing protein [Thermoleophilia bacterium]
MSAPIHKYSSEPGSSRRWIAIILIIILVAAAAFAGLAFYMANRGPVPAKTAGSFTGPVTPPPPEYRCPLDGSETTSFAATEKRPVLVQVDNAPAARPQSGLSMADIVYEAMAEGDVTRFSAIFACREVDSVGPVRSARLINLELVPEYTALLANSGSSRGVSDALEAAALPNINHPSYPDAYWRVDDRIAPHNMMTSTADIRAAAESSGIPAAYKVTSLIFKDDSPAPSVTNIGVPYSGIVDVEYRYDPGTNGWLRSISGEPHMDALTGTQIAPRNVIIQYVNISESDIEEDAGGNMGLDFGLQGTGRVQVFRDGQLVEGAWERAGESSVTMYLDATGKPILLNRGLTFVQLVPVGFQPVIT